MRASRSRAVAGAINPSATWSTAICSAAHGVRLAVRVCRRKSSPSWTVNSNSWASPNFRLEQRGGALELLVQRGFHTRCRRRRTCERLAAGDDVLTLGAGEEVHVETRLAPSDGSRVKATPAPDRPPPLPKTIRCTITAVPMSSGHAGRSRRYVARLRRPPRSQDCAERPAPAARAGRPEKARRSGRGSARRDRSGQRPSSSCASSSTGCSTPARAIRSCTAC